MHETDSQISSCLKLSSRSNTLGIQQAVGQKIVAPNHHINAGSQFPSEEIGARGLELGVKRGSGI